MLQFKPNRGYAVFTSSILTFDSKKMGTTRVVELVKGIGKIGITKILLLGNNAITDQAIPAIVEHLILNPKISLEKLDLGGNLLTNEGAQQLISALKQRNTLHELFIKGNSGIEPQYLKEIAELMANNQKKSEASQELH